MVVICEECGLKYQIDPTKIKGDKARFNCKGCSTSIIVDKRDAEVEEDLSALEEALLADSDSDTDAAIGSMGDNIEAEDKTAFSKEPIEEIPTSATAAPVIPVEKVKKRSGLGLTAKVIMLMLVVSLLPGAAYFALSFKQMSDQITKESNKTGSTVTKQLQKAFKQDIINHLTPIDKTINI